MFLAYLIIILISCIGYIHQKKRLPDSFKYLFMLLVFTLIIEISKFLLEKNGINKNPLEHLYQVIELPLLSIVFYNMIENPVIKLAIKRMAIFLPIVFLASSLFVEGLMNENTISFIIESIIIIFYSVIYIWEIYMDTKVENPLKVSFVWICTGFLLYYAGTFFQMGLHDYFSRKNPSLAESLGYINKVFNYLLYILFIIGFYAGNR